MDEIDAEVAKYMRRREPEYVKFLDDVLGDLYRFKDRSSLSGAIYRIYSRADKQLNGRKLKTEEGIAKTIRRWRAEGNPNARIHELHDIIGVTIVTYFDSEVPRIVEALKKTDSFKGFFSSFDFIDTWRKPGENEKSVGGYFAQHVKVASGQGAGVKPVLCEIQVKSLLNDGWAAKTHDLVYKAKAAVDPEVRRQAEVIGGMVNALEQMSDGLRILITRNLQIEDERRTAAISRLMRQTLDSMAASGSDDERTWYKKLVDRLDHFSSCEDNDPELGRLVDGWREKVGRTELTQIGCRLLLLLALVRRSPSAASDAFDAIEEWTSSLTEPADKIKAARFGATSHWALGQYDQAIEICRNLVRGGVVDGLAYEMTKIDLAYYLAERSFTRDGNCAPEVSAEIEEFIAGWDGEPNDRIRMSRQDSVGAIRIMSATTADDVFAGHQLCAQAKEWAVAQSKDAEVFDDFYRLHTERARRRIQELPPL